MRDYVERYQSIYSNMFPQMQHRVDWAGEVLEKVETERRRRVPEDRLRDRQVWRDRRLMALAAHKKKSDESSDNDGPNLIGDAEAQHFPDLGLLPIHQLLFRGEARGAGGGARVLSPEADPERACLQTLDFPF